MVGMKELSLKFGSSQGKEPLKFPVTPITVFVGPNNSGKSYLIRELERFFRYGENLNNKILEKVSYIALVKEEIDDYFNNGELEFRKANDSDRFNILIGGETIPFVFYNKDEIEYIFKNPNIGNNIKTFPRLYISYKVLLLHGLNRLNLLEEEEGYDLRNKEKPRGTLQKLYYDNKKRTDYREYVYEGLDVYPVIDTCDLGKIRLNFSENKPMNEDIERSQKEEAIEFHRKAVLLNEVGDGRKAYAGILAAVIAGNPEILLMDEPEAFLHPALSQKLGKQLAFLLKENKKHLFVATHSASFLMGAIHSGVLINIVRLTYHKKKPTARILESARLVDLMRKPLLRSVNALGALFYENVIITESDSDRAFYQEINERLLAAKKGGIPNLLLLNAQNKQTIPSIMKPLRDLGIPVAAIYDIDFLFDKRKEGGSYLDTAYIPESKKKALESQRSNLAERILEGDNKERDADKEKRNDLKKNGIYGFAKAEEMKKELEEYCDELAEYGVFLVKEGELESWLRELEVDVSREKKTQWLLEIFEKMGEDPEDPDYFHPGDNDVWLFINEIAAWFDNSNRKGLPD